jgi:hypothetical protein
VERVGPAQAIRVVATRDHFQENGPGQAHFVPAAEFALIC